MLISTVKLKPGFILRELGGEFCIAFESDTSNGALDGLPSINETGIFLWHKLELGCTPQELVETLVAQKGLDYEDAEADVGEFLAKLINGHIVDYTK